MPKVYKKFTKKEIDSRPVSSATADVKNTTQTILQNFVNYFKAKHLS